MAFIVAGMAVISFVFGFWMGFIVTKSEMRNILANYTLKCLHRDSR